MNMDSLDTGLTLDSLVFAIDAIQPYVLGWPLGEELHGRGGRGHSLANHAGLLLALPSVFLPQAVIDHGNSGEDGIFGPSVLVNAPAVIFEGGIVSPTGTTVDAMIIDCTVDVLVYMREFQQYEDLVYNFDEDSPYAFPAIDALLPKDPCMGSKLTRVTSRLLHARRARGGGVSPVHVPKLPRRKAAAKATPTGGGPKPKRPTTASLASDMQGLLSTLPKITEQLSQISERQAALESRIPLPGKAPAIGLGQSLASNLNAPPPPVSELMRTLRPPPTQSQTLKPL